MKIKEVHGWYKLRNYNGNCTLTQKKGGGKKSLNNIEGRADRRRPRDRTLRSSQRNLSPVEGMILGKDRKVKEECQERDIKIIIKRVSAHCLTEVSPTPSWTCSTQLCGPCAMSNILKHTYTHTNTQVQTLMHAAILQQRSTRELLTSSDRPSSLSIWSTRPWKCISTLGPIWQDHSALLSLCQSIPARCTVTSMLLFECKVFGGEKKMHHRNLNN